MGNKIEYIMGKIEISEKPTMSVQLLEFFKNKKFILQEKPKKQHCLWLQFSDTNEIWRSVTSITNIDEMQEGLIIKTRGEVYHIHKCKQS